MVEAASSRLGFLLVKKFFMGGYSICYADLCNPCVFLCFDNFIAWVFCYSNADQDGSKTIVASVRDVTSDKAGLTRLVDDCNRLELSTVHLNDVVEDFLLK